MCHVENSPKGGAEAATASPNKEPAKSSQSRIVMDSEVAGVTWALVGMLKDRTAAVSILYQSSIRQ